MPPSDVVSIHRSKRQKSQGNQGFLGDNFLITAGTSKRFLHIVKPVLPFVSTDRTIVLLLCVSLGRYANNGGCSVCGKSIKSVAATLSVCLIGDKKISAHPSVAETLINTVFMKQQNERLSDSVRPLDLHTVSN